MCLQVFLKGKSPGLVEEFKGIPNNKNLEQSNIQIEEEIVKVKQQKKMPEPNWQEMMKFMAEQSRQTNENLRKQNKYLSKKFDKKETF